MDALTLRLAYQRWSAHQRLSPRGRLIRCPRDAPIQVQVASDETRAARAAAAGRDGDARRHAGRGLDRLASWTSSFGSLDLQSSVAMHGSGLLREGLAAALRSRRPEVVFEWSERARHLNQQVVPLRPPLDPGMAADLAELRRLRAEDASGEWLTDPHAVALRDRARRRQWSATGGAALEAPASLDEVRVALGDDIALASYLVVGDALTCLVASERDIRMVDLGSPSTVRSVLAGLRADLDVSASIRTGPMAAVAARSPRGATRRALPPAAPTT